MASILHSNQGRVNRNKLGCKAILPVRFLVERRDEKW